MRLDSEQRARIEKAVAEAERRTSAEFVVAVEPKSRGYGEWRAAVTAVATFLLSLGVYLFFPRLSPGWILASQPLVALAAWLFFGLRPVLMRIVPDAFEIAAVEARAKTIFFDAGIHRTAGRGGLLIFLSDLEHRVHLLADDAVLGALPPEALPRHVQTIVAAARAGDTTSGICQVLESLSRELEPVLPRRAGDKNELPNQVHTT